jgi:hypothetical protein
MKSALMALVTLMSFSALATSTQDLCNGYYITSEITVKTCVASVFINDHQNTEYGSEIYLAKSSEVKKSRLKNLLGKAKREFFEDDVTRSIPSYFVVDNFIEVIGSHSYFAFVLEEHDLPRYHVYAINPNAKNQEKALIKIAQFYADGVKWDNDDFTANEETFGFSTQSLFLGSIE